MKTIVINELENTRVPFLRGILTRSLLDAGLPFEQAFQVASKVRDQLSDSASITSEELRRRIVVLLEELGDEQALDQYTVPAAAPDRIEVNSLSGIGQRIFSRPARQAPAVQRLARRESRVHHRTDLRPIARYRRHYHHDLSAGIPDLPLPSAGSLQKSGKTLPGLVRVSA